VEKLKTLGCDLLQGPHYSAPLGAPEFIKKFRAD
jgi:EAL domain-containing protein (putative c-di-GMP-specific phosphodiesterase class I)